MKTKHQKAKLVGISLAFFLIFFLSLAIGSEKISIYDVFKSLFQPADYSKIQTIILQLRLPRALAAVLIGGALASSGLVFQATLNNPMADPYMLGVSAGAALGASIGFLLQLHPLFSATLAFIGSIGSIAIVYVMSIRHKRMNTNTLILSGIALSFLLSAIVSLLIALNRKKMEQIVFWTMGSLNSVRLTNLFYISIPLILGTLTFLFFWKDLNLLLIGEEQAQTTGSEVNKVRKQLILLAAFNTSLAVSLGGIIGFVGLIIPHASRLIVGTNHKISLPVTMALGAAFLLVSDTLARTIISPMQLPIGVITSILGGPYFIFLLLNRGGHK